MVPGTFGARRARGLFRGVSARTSRVAREQPRVVVFGSGSFSGWRLFPRFCAQFPHHCGGLAGRLVFVFRIALFFFRLFYLPRSERGFYGGNIAYSVGRFRLLRTCPPPASVRSFLLMLRRNSLTRFARFPSALHSPTLLWPLVHLILGLNSVGCPGSHDRGVGLWLVTAVCGNS